MTFDKRQMEFKDVSGRQEIELVCAMLASPGLIWALVAVIHWFAD